MAKVKRTPGSKPKEPPTDIPSRPAAGQNPPAAQGPSVPIRPCRSTNGKAVDLRANYFDLTFTGKPLTVYKYTFKILGRKEQEIRGATAKDVFRSVLPSLEAQPHMYATDFQHQIVTLGPLKIPDNEEKRLHVEGFDGCTIEFEHTVQLQLGTSVLASPSSDVIDCLNLIMGQWAREQNDIATIGRHRFFRRPNNPKLKRHVETGIPELLSVTRGFFQSVRPAENKLLLNANATLAVFRPAGNIGKMCRLLKERAQNPNDALARLHGVISKARVSYELKLPKTAEKPSPRRVVRIAGFARKTDKDSRNEDPARSLVVDEDFPGPKQVRFWVENEYRTVWDHFQKRWGLKLWDDVPLINMGRPDRPEYVPAEYCDIIWGQPLKLKVTEIPGLTPGKLNELNEFTFLEPGSNQSWIKSVHRLQELNVDPDTNRVLSNFGVAVQKELLSVSGRKLNNPSISYWNNDSFPLDGPSWNVAGRRLVKGPRPGRRWTWIYFGGDSQDDIHPDAKQGVGELYNHLGKLCPQGSRPELVKFEPRCTPRGGGIAALRTSLARIAQISGIQLVVVVCPNRLPADTYNALKFFGDIQIGIHTSCILAKKFKKRGKGQQPWDPSYFSNVALKINLKLGGNNHKLEKALDLSNQDAALMVVGYDVTHPTEDEKSKAEEGGKTGADGKGLHDSSKQSLPGNKTLVDETKKRSQVGLVISADDNLGQWLSSYWDQKPRKEMADGTFTEKFKTLLGAWRLVNAINTKKGVLNVVIYRDGVSESQFGQVLQQEVPNIRQAYKTVFGAKQIRITLVVAIKRHATRFFPVEYKARDRGNIEPGTVVDNGVTQQKYWEFFLAAHFALQGTAKPTRYVVVLDEIFQKSYGNNAPVNSAAQLEKFTHDLSYLFGRANKAVSVCTPAYYADVLCTRARAYMAALAHPETRSEIEKSIADKPGEVKKRILAGKIHPLLEKSMYWI